MPKRTTLPLALLTAALTAATMSGCVANRPAGAGAVSGGAISVQAADDSCAVSTSTVESGTSVFSVTNSGSRVTEFEILAEDGLTIVGELENIGPGLTRSVSVQAQPGSYSTLCKPGMVGDGVGAAAFTVTGEAVVLTGDAAALADDAASRYVSYVRDQADRLLTATEDFAGAYAAGDDDAARAQYPTARAFYERIEPIAESFGDLDPQLDAREGDVAEGAEWTGWHRIEKDLWQPGDDALDEAGRATAAAYLVERTRALQDRVDAADFTVTADSISNGAIGLLDEVALSKITGEEEAYSHTDLWDFQANVEGAEVAYRGVRPIAETTDPALVEALDTRFAALNDLLAQYGSLEDGFTSYTDLTPEDVRTLSDSVNALGEPLSTLTSAVLG